MRTATTKIGSDRGGRKSPPRGASATKTAKLARNCSSTDLQLSFFSGHASATGAVSATATYLAFVRGGHRSLRPWLTLAGGIALTTFVSYERVRSGMHFPTDVIMGSLAGASIGVLVPHLHRRPHYHEKELESVPLWIGFAPTAGGGGGGTLTLGGML